MCAWRAGAADGAQSPRAGERTADRNAAGSLCRCRMCFQYCGGSQSLCYRSMDHGGGPGVVEWYAGVVNGQPGYLCAQWNAFADHGGSAPGDGDVGGVVRGWGCNIRVIGFEQV